MERIEISPYYAEADKVQEIAHYLKKGKLVILPTDTVYAIACNGADAQAVERLCKAVGKKPSTALLSLLCADFRQITELTAPISGPVFRAMKNVLPGPFTFILKSASQVEKLFHSKRKTIGVRIPDHPVCLAVIEAFGAPLMATSLHSDDHILEYANDPDEIIQSMGSIADVIVDNGYCGIEPSTILDCSSGDIELIREGKGHWER
jgi:tRNA threonylcarbamoyl adenosine modification protein (Sua5/YciO/YrdC/YwlC family)